MRTIAAIGLFALLPLLAGVIGGPSNENIGAVTGSLIGGAAVVVLTGSYPGVIAGAMIGAYIGNRAGEILDPRPSSTRL